MGHFLWVSVATDLQIELMVQTGVLDAIKDEHSESDGTPRSNYDHNYTYSYNNGNNIYSHNLNLNLNLNHTRNHYRYHYHCCHNHYDNYSS
jgi:hypothetical protein